MGIAIDHRSSAFFSSFDTSESEVTEKKSNSIGVVPAYICIRKSAGIDIRERGRMTKPLVAVFLDMLLNANTRTIKYRLTKKYDLRYIHIYI